MWPLRGIVACGAPLLLLLAGDAWAGFVDIHASLTGVRYASSAWGDYDNDGDLDILLTGNATSGRIARVYRNDGADFVAVADLIGVDCSSAAWGDYDADGDLDILLTGSTATVGISRVYRNDAGAFADIGAGLPGVDCSSVAWGDYDNDGDLDILLTGDASGEPVSIVFRNDGGSFADIGADLTGVYYSSVAWGDYDGDGDLDILLTGDDGLTPVAAIYRNDDGVFADARAGLPGVYVSSAAWGDYDGDGDLDVLLTGHNGVTGISGLYRNDGGGFADAGAGLPGVYVSSSGWGDYDNDGVPDILLTGQSDAAMISRVYRDDGGAFTDIDAGLPGVIWSSAAWGDGDGDGDLDIMLTGLSGSKAIARVYRSDGEAPNTPPEAPTGLLARVDYEAGQVVFDWNAATDAETPAAALTYNLRVGTTPGGGDVVPPMSGPDGRRRIVAAGNASQRPTWTMNAPVPGLYYWSVQTVDAAFEGSPFAIEHVVSVATDVAAAPAPALAFRGARPNPFTGSTVLAFTLARAGDVELDVYDVSGRLVRALARGRMEAGEHQSRWDGRDESGRSVPAGLYLCRLRAGGVEARGRVVRVP